MPKKRYADWEANHVLIHDVFLKLLGDKKGRKPTLTELAKETGLHLKTIERHLHDLEFKPQSDSLRLLTGDVSLALWRRCLKGDPSAIKLWYQVIEGFNERGSQTEDARATDFAAVFQAAIRNTAGGNVPPGTSGVASQ